jgi:uncharacterized membrane protein
MTPHQDWTDRRIEITVANLLRAGVLLAAFFVLVGAIIYLARHGRSPADYRVFQGEPTELKTLGGILRSALALRGQGIIQLGLLLLIATPVARVAFSMWGFAEERDRMYVGYTAIVLGVLLYGLFGSAIF